MSSVVAPTLLLFGWCSSFVLSGAHRLSSRRVIRFSWSVPPERVTTLKVTPTPTQHAVSRASLL